MGRKSSSQDKGEGALDKAKGKAKEAAGAATGDKEKKAEGRSDQTKGTAKDKVGKAKDYSSNLQTRDRCAKGRSYVAPALYYALCLPEFPRGVTLSAAH